jgi:hypothetical protein
VRRIDTSKCDSYTLSASDRAELAKHADLDRVLETLQKEEIVKAKDTWNSIEFHRPKEGMEEDAYKGRIGRQGTGAEERDRR